ncbi:signal peptidase II [Mediterraneibacter sp. ICN-202921]|uniref:signal peptidase II n=1 Tax=Mediterraneibacter sp. ICN-202921 TaxID=3134657 RepID=UPI0030BD3F0B
MEKEKTTDLKSIILACVGFTALLFLDQYTKQLAVTHLKNKEPFTLIDGVFQLHYLENRGAAFGIFQDKQLLFVAGAVCIVLVVSFMYVRLPHRQRYIPLRICFVFLCAGAVGNMIDRIHLNYVIDFLYFEWIDFPIFNVADCYVVAAGFLFVILILFFYKDEELHDLSLCIRRKKCDRTK